MAQPTKSSRGALNLAPARWIWFPSARTLPNTFVLFRKTLTLKQRPRRATGWASGDSRYLFSANGKRVQWGPSCCDPRTLDADPLDLTEYLREGRNILGAQVLYFGQGDGTYVAGKPGFILNLELEYPGGRRERITTNSAWSACLDRSRRPGQYRRWYLRAIQEEFDARLFPHGWDEAAFDAGPEWMPAMELNAPADKPPLCSDYPDSMTDMTAEAGACRIVAREAGPMREEIVRAGSPVEQGRVRWSRDPNDWFEMRTPCFEIRKTPTGQARGEGWVLPANPDARTGHYLTFELPEQMTGFPFVELDAPEGTVVELLWQESHDLAGKRAWLDTHFHFWARMTCREGKNQLETFDFECPRWLQLHVRNASRPVTVKSIGVRRRLYVWPNEPHVRCGEPALQRLFDSCLNTINNNTQGAIQSDGARERQQYSGDGMAQMHSHRYAFGESRLTARYLRTMSAGITSAGYFLDAWPAMDRMIRIPERELNFAPWGPLLDIGVCLVIDAWHHYFETADLDPIRETYPRFARFAAYLENLRTPQGLLPVEDLGVPTVWMDHYAYKHQRHKQCSFVLLAAIMFSHALPRLAKALGNRADAKRFAATGHSLGKAAQRVFWDQKRRLFVANRPWRNDEKETRLDDLSLAFSAIYGFCPRNDVQPSIAALASLSPKQSPHFLNTLLKENDLKNQKIKPSKGNPELSLSYPPNQRWRCEALAQFGRADVVLREWREIWAQMPSVLLNKTIAEEWTHEPDSIKQWNHNGVNPLSILFMNIAGIRPLEPGFRRCRIRPQLGDMPSLELTSHTPRGPIQFNAVKRGVGHHLRLEIPKGIDAELWLPTSAKAPAGLTALGRDAALNVTRYRLPKGRSFECTLA